MYILIGRMSTLLRILVTVIALVAAAPAQWLNYPTAVGEPDLSGIWAPTDTSHFMDLAVDLKPADLPYQPWAKALAERRQEAVHKDDPLAQCMPPGVPRVEAPGKATRLVSGRATRW